MSFIWRVAGVDSHFARARSSAWNRYGRCKGRFGWWLPHLAVVQLTSGPGRRLCCFDSCHLDPGVGNFEQLLLVLATHAVGKVRALARPLKIFRYAHSLIPRVPTPKLSVGIRTERVCSAPDIAWLLSDPGVGFCFDISQQGKSGHFRRRGFRLSDVQHLTVQFCSDILTKAPQNLRMHMIGEALLTSAACQKRAEQKLALAESDPRHYRRLINAAQSWLLLASGIRQLERRRSARAAANRRRTRHSASVATLDVSVGPLARHSTAAVI